MSEKLVKFHSGGKFLAEIPELAASGSRTSLVESLREYSMVISNFCVSKGYSASAQCVRKVPVPLRL